MLTTATAFNHDGLKFDIQRFATAPVDSSATTQPAPFLPAAPAVDVKQEPATIDIADAIERFNNGAHGILHKAYDGVAGYRRIRNLLTGDMLQYLETAGRPADLADTLQRCIDHFNRKATNYNKSHKGANLELIRSTADANPQKAIDNAAAGNKFNGLTLNPLAKNLVDFIANELVKLGKNVSCSTVNTAGKINGEEYDGFVIVNAGALNCVKLTFTNAADEVTQWFIDKYWGKPSAVTKDLYKRGGVFFDITKKFFTKAAQYLGLIKRPPAPPAKKDVAKLGLMELPLVFPATDTATDSEYKQEFSLFEQNYTVKHAVTNFTRRCFEYKDMPGYENCAPATWTDADWEKFFAARDEFFKRFTPQEKGARFDNWQDAFDFIQAFAPADYRFKDAAYDALLFTADTGFGFVVNVKSAAAIAAEQLIFANQISSITFGRIIDNRLQLDSDADKILVLGIGGGKNPSPSELQEWFGLNAASKNSAARFGKPVEVYCYKGGDKFFTTNFFEFDKAHCPKVGDQLIVECGSTKMYCEIFTSDADGVRIRFFDSSLVNPNGGVPAYGYEDLDIGFSPAPRDVNLVGSIDLSGFALKGKRQITKITLVPRVSCEIATAHVDSAAH